MLFVVSLSGFKLPHYLNIVFPTTSVLVAIYIIQQKEKIKWIRSIYIIQLILVGLLLLLAGVLNVWAFPVKSGWVIAGVVLLLALIFYFIKSTLYNWLQKTVTISVAGMLFLFFLLNSNFYPGLLKYQGGKELADSVKSKINTQDVYFWKNTFSSSFNFHSQTLYKAFADSVVMPGKKAWLIYDSRDEEQIKQAGYELLPVYTVLDYEITKLDIKFITPAKRESQCSKMVLAEIYLLNR
jgi:hypothetical protein